MTIPHDGDEAELIEFHFRNAAFFKPWLPRPAGDLSDPGFWAKWINLSQALFVQNQAVHLIVRLRDAPELIVGQVDYSLMLRGPLNSTMIGFQIDQKFAGRGLMREAIALSLGYIFHDRGIHRVIAAYVPENHRSAFLLNSLGFVGEGKARDFLEIDGVRRDHVISALLSTDKTRERDMPVSRATPDLGISRHYP